MFTIFAEILTTMALFLLAGEYLQGDSKKFNRAVARLAMKIYPHRWLVNGRPTTKIGADIFRLNRSVILREVVFPFVFVIAYSFGITNIVDSNGYVKKETEWRTIVAAQNDPKYKPAVQSAQDARAAFEKECAPLIIDAAKRLSDNEPNNEELEKSQKKLTDCLSKYDSKMAIHSDIDIPFATKVWILVKHGSGDAVIAIFGPVFLFVFSFIFLAYFVAVARFYARVMKIDSFILPLASRI